MPELDQQLQRYHSVIFNIQFNRNLHATEISSQFQSSKGFIFKYEYHYSKLDLKFQLSVCETR